METVSISLNKIFPNPNNLFETNSEHEFEDLLQSVKSNGVLNPLLVRPKGFKGDMEILSGNRRYSACRAAGFNSVPCIVVSPQNEYEATIIAIEANRQRSLDGIKPSQRIKIISKWYVCLLKTGKIIEEKNDDETAENADNNDICAPWGHSVPEENNCFELSLRTAKRYNKISTLPEYHLTRIDTGKISIRAAYELSFVSALPLQLLDVVLNENDKLSVTSKAAVRIRQLSNNNKIKSADDIVCALSDERPTKKKKSSIHLKPKVLRKYFSDENEKEIESEIDKALSLKRVILPNILNQFKFTGGDDEVESVISDALKQYFTNQSKKIESENRLAAPDEQG